MCKEQVKKALLVTFDKYPDMDAGAVRVHMLAKILIEAGYNVIVISMGETTNFLPKVEKDGIQHISFRGKSGKTIFKVLYYLLFPIRLLKILSKMRVDVIVHTQLNYTCLQIMRMYTKRHGNKLVYDSVEWFSESEYKKGARDRSFKLNNNYNIKWVDSPSKVVAISTFLKEHFDSRGIDSILIPVIMDVYQTGVQKELNNEIIEILYAGRPGRKDYIDIMCSAIDMLSDEERNRIRFVILGCDEDQLIKVCNADQELLERNKNAIHARGRVPRSVVLEEYCKADFTILLRPKDERYAKAGFPTKFVESMTCSTPVICNLTSDLSKYAKDHENCIVLQDIEPKTVANTLKRVLRLPKQEIITMGKKARITAERRFDYHNYADAFLELIGQKEDSY